MEIVHEKYPKTGDIEKFPHGECMQELQKACIRSKIKKIRSDYKEAVDLGKGSGVGRIIMTFYDLSQDIWAGFPATTNLSSGFDSSMVSQDSTVRVEKEKAEEVSALSDNENDEIKIQQKSNDRRTHISKYLKDEKAKRLSKRQSNEAQSVNLGKGESSLKRRLIERVDAADNEFREQMRKMTKIMEIVRSFDITKFSFDDNHDESCTGYICY